MTSHKICSTQSNSNFHVETIMNSFNKENFNVSTASRIDEILQKALSFIYPQNCKMHVLAIRAKDISSNKTMAYLYATGLDGVFSLEFIFVKEAARRSGLGTILYNKALQQAFEWKMKKIKLCTYEFQAPEFYEKLGFNRTSQISDALEGYSLIYLNKKLEDIEKTSSAQITNSKLEFEAYTSEKFNPTELFNKPNTEIRKIYDKSISGLAKFNTSYLESKDGIPREYRQFVICLKEQNTNEIVSVISGLVLIGKPSGTTLTPDLVSFKTDFEINKEGLGIIYQTLSGLAQTYSCKVLVSYEKNVENELERIGFSTESSPRLVKITPISKDDFI